MVKPKKHNLAPRVKWQTKLKNKHKKIYIQHQTGNYPQKTYLNSTTIKQYRHISPKPPKIRFGMSSINNNHQPRLAILVSICSQFNQIEKRINKKNSHVK